MPLLIYMTVSLYDTNRMCITNSLETGKKRILKNSSKVKTIQVQYKTRTEPEYAQFLKINTRTGMLFPSSKLKTDVLVNLLSEPTYCTLFSNFILVLVLS